ncbi:hypothetical protein DV735_g834, partial [Chaetothyriales sp. CBS 134920]
MAAAVATEIPTHHKAILYDEPGKISTKIEQVETPKPGVGQVLIRLTHTGVCHSDMGVMTNSWAWLYVAFRLSRTTTDFCADQHRRRKVRSVATREVGADSCCVECKISGYYTPGTFQQYALAPANYVTPIPDGLPSDVAAPMLCGGLTVYSALKKSGAQPGDWVVIAGAGGGLGHLAVQIGARGMGFRMIGIDAGSKEQLVKDCGAEAFFDVTKYSRDDEGAAKLAADVKAVTGRANGAAAVVVCTASNAAYAQALGFLKFNGSLVCVGVPEGTPVPIASAVPATILVNQLKIVGSAVGNRQEAIETLEMAARGIVKTHFVVEKMDKLTEVFQKMDKGEIQGPPPQVPQYDTSTWGIKYNQAQTQIPANDGRARPQLPPRPPSSVAFHGAPAVPSNPQTYTGQQQLPRWQAQTATSGFPPPQRPPRPPEYQAQLQAPPRPQEYQTQLQAPYRADSLPHPSYSHKPASHHYDPYAQNGQTSVYPSQQQDLSLTSPVPSSHIGSDNGPVSPIDPDTSPGSRPTATPGPSTASSSQQGIHRTETIDSVIGAWDQPYHASENPSHIQQLEKQGEVQQPPPDVARSHPQQAEKIVEKVVDPYSDLRPEFKASLNRYVAMLRKEAAADSDEERFGYFESFVRKELRLRSLLYGIEPHLQDLHSTPKSNGTPTLAKVDPVGPEVAPESRSSESKTKELPPSEKSVVPEPVRSNAPIAASQAEASQTRSDGQAQGRSSTTALKPPAVTTPTLPPLKIASSATPDRLGGGDTDPEYSPGVIESQARTKPQDYNGANRLDAASASLDHPDATKASNAAPALKFEPPRPAYEPFKYNANIQPPTQPAHQSYSSLRKDATDSNRLLVHEPVNHPKTSPDSRTKTPDGQRDQDGNFIGLIKAHSQAVQPGKSTTASLAPTPQLRADTPNAGPALSQAPASRETQLGSANSALRSVLPASLPERYGLSQHPKARALEARIGGFSDDFSFIRETVVAWDRKNREVRKKLDEERSARQAESESHIDGLFHDNEIGYADIGHLEAEFKLHEAEKRYKEDQAELDSFTKGVYEPVTERIKKEISELDTDYAVAVELLESDAVAASQYLRADQGKRSEMGFVMNSALSAFQKMETRHQKLAEADVERERRRKRLELTVLYTNGDTQGVKKVEQEFAAAEKRQVLHEARARDRRANSFMDTIDHAAVRGLGDNQTYMDDLLARIRPVKEMVLREPSNIPQEVYAPDGPRDSLSLAQRTIDFVLTDSQKLLNLSSDVDKLLNEADYFVSVAEARVSNADQVTYQRLAEEKQKEDAKILNDTNSRLSSIGKTPEAAIALIREVVDKVGDDPEHRERIKKALEAAKKRNTIIAPADSAQAKSRKSPPSQSGAPPASQSTGALMGPRQNETGRADTAGPSSGGPATTLSAPLATLSESLHQGSDEAMGDGQAHTSPVSLSSMGTLESVAGPTVMTTTVGSPLPMEDSVPPASAHADKGLSTPENDNKAMSYPAPYLTPQVNSDARRGMSLPHSATRQEKPYVCSTCQSRFRRLHDLKRHTKLHTGERPHVCPKCRRKFARGDALARHNKGPGGCAGRRASMGSFGGGDGGFEGGEDMDGVVYGEPESFEEEEGNDKRPGIRRQAPSGDDSQDGSGQGPRIPSTYPPIQGRPPGGIATGHFPPRGGFGPPLGPASPVPGPPTNSLVYGSHTGSTSSRYPTGSYAQNPITESPRPLSPGQSRGTSGPLDHRNRSPTITSYTQGPGSSFGRNAGSGSSMILSSAATQLPPPPGFLPSQTGPTHPPTQPTGPPTHVGSGPLSSNSNSLSSHGQSGHGSVETSSPMFAKDDRIWAYVKSLEQRMNGMQEEINALRAQLMVAQGQQRLA